MYFIITGQRDELIQAALSYLHPTGLTTHPNSIYTFETDYPERLATAGFAIKRWLTGDTARLKEQSQNYTLLGTAKKEIWQMLKSQFPHFKRFKTVELVSTDKEVKEEWIEVINIDGRQWWIVKWYQNIPLYETIDFAKPVKGMGIGMMPSKLAHTLINIGIGEYETILPNHQISHPLTIRDPFCGFGTTNFLANYLWYHTIGSDLNITSVKQNRKRRASHSSDTEDFSDTEKRSTFIKQDVTSPLSSPLFHHADIIISEGWLGHVVTNRTAPAEIKRYAQEVLDMVIDFAKNLTDIYKKNLSSSSKGGSKAVSLVMTIPVWLKYDISISHQVVQYITTLWRSIKLLKDPYSRPGQLVGRQILIGSIILNKGKIDNF